MNARLAASQSGGTPPHSTTQAKKGRENHGDGLVYGLEGRIYF